MTPSSAGSSPIWRSAASPSCPRARSPACARVSSTPWRWPRSPRTSTSARSCCSAAARTRPAAARSRRSCPTRSRPCSARCTSTAGRTQAYALVERLIGPRLAATADHLDHLDHKSRLQEQVAGDGGAPPEYVTRAEGPDHAKRFFAAVVVAGQVHRRGHGPLEEGGRAVGGGRGVRHARRSPRRRRLSRAGAARGRDGPARLGGARRRAHDRGRLGRARALGAPDVGPAGHRRADRARRSSPPTAAASTCCCRSTPATS